MYCYEKLTIKTKAFTIVLVEPAPEQLVEDLVVHLYKAFVSTFPGRGDSFPLSISPEDRWVERRCRISAKINRKRARASVGQSKKRGKRACLVACFEEIDALLANEHSALLALLLLGINDDLRLGNKDLLVVMLHQLQLKCL